MKMVETYLRLPTLFSMSSFHWVVCLHLLIQIRGRMLLFNRAERKKKKKQAHKTFSSPIRLNIGKATAADVSLAHTTLTTGTGLCYSSFRAWTQWEGRPLTPASNLRLLILLMISLFFSCSGDFPGERSFSVCFDCCNRLYIAANSLNISRSGE